MKESIKKPYFYEETIAGKERKGLLVPNKVEGDLTGEHLLLVLNALFEFTRSHDNKLPRLHNQDDAEELLRLTNKILQENEKGNENADNNNAKEKEFLCL